MFIETFDEDHDLIAINLDKISYVTYKTRAIGFDDDSFALIHKEHFDDFMTKLKDYKGLEELKHDQQS